MKSKESLIELLEEVNLKINCLVEVLTISNTGVDQYSLKCCDVKWAQAGFPLTIGGVIYKIASVDYSKNIIVVIGPSAITAKQFLLYRPYFFSGTPIDTGTDLAKEADQSKKTPMIWLLETFKEKFNENKEEEEERRSPVRLFFLTQSDLTKRPEALNNEYVIPTTRLKDAFIKSLEGCFSRFNTQELSYETTYFPKFGVYITDKGAKEKLWADDLSGCEIDPELILYKLNQCCGEKETFYFADEQETFIFTDENGNPFSSEL